jgi:1-acyl-sn-glycerol-3-phosphate acyltransferase
MNKALHLITWIMQHVGWSVSFLLFRVFGEVRIYGREHIPSGPCIFASNHIHELDPMVLVLMHSFFSSQFPFTFVTNPKEKYKTFGWRGYIYGGIFFNLLGGYSVYSGQKDYAYALQKHVELIREGYSVYIFPEGKRSSDGTLGEARGGVGYLASTTGVPVVPVAISGLEHFSWKDFILRRRSLVLSIGVPHVYAPASQKDDFVSISKQILNDIRDLKISHSEEKVFMKL